MKTKMLVVFMNGDEKELLLVPPDSHSPLRWFFRFENESGQTVYCNPDTIANMTPTK